MYYREWDGSLESWDIPTATQAVPLSRERIDLGFSYKAAIVVETIEAEFRPIGQV